MLDFLFTKDDTVQKSSVSIFHVGKLREQPDVSVLC
jgi:hypothetical protein